MSKKQDALYKFYKSLNRELFVDEEQKSLAHFDHALPIGYGQTISQPSLVCEMVKELNVEKNHSVLEIGTGSGYQTAFLAEFSKHVYTIEYIKELQEQAKQRLTSLGYRSISYHVGDGSDGWEKHAPYDRIIASCAASSVPEALLKQLATNGVLVIPVGTKHHQNLIRINKNKKGEISKHSICPVRFVEFIGQYGWTNRE